MLNALMKGFLIVVILVSIIILPLQLWYSPYEVHLYCKQAIVAMCWLWLIISPLMAIGLRLGRRIFAMQKY